MFDKAKVHEFVSSLQISTAVGLTPKELSYHQILILNIALLHVVLTLMNLNC